MKYCPTKEYHSADFPRTLANGAENLGNYTLVKQAENLRYTISWRNETGLCDQTPCVLCG
jgi:hypothetical protein